ncbi:MAG: type 1 glutamine amidotransferase domain-containing protein [Thermodesulfobacteriota bacterium]
MNLKGKTVAILVEDLYQELEVWYPLLRLQEAGAEVIVVGSGSAKQHQSKLGYPVEVDKFAHEVKAEAFDAVVVPGGYAPDLMRRYPAMVSLVRDAAQDGRVVAAICHGGWMLASADVVRGKNVTAFFSIKDDLVNAGANFVDEKVVVDENLITSRQPEDLPAFCHALLFSLGSELRCPVCQTPYTRDEPWD